MMSEGFSLRLRVDASISVDREQTRWYIHINGQKYEIESVSTDSGTFKIERNENNPTVVTWVKEERE